MDAKTKQGPWKWGTSSNKEKYPGFIVYREANGEAAILCSDMTKAEAQELAKKQNELEALTICKVFGANKTKE